MTTNKWIELSAALVVLVVGAHDVAASECRDLTLDQRSFQTVVFDARDGRIVTQLRGGRARVGLDRQEQAGAMAEQIAECNRRLFGLGSARLRTAATQLVAASRDVSEPLARVFAAQLIDGVPVDGRGMQFVFAGRDLVEVRSTLATNLDASTRAGVSAAEAAAASQRSLGLDSARDKTKTALIINVEGTRPILLWKIEHRGIHRLDGFVDAATGVYLRSFDHHHASVDGQGTGAVVSSGTDREIGFTNVRIVKADEPTTVLDQTTSDAGGYYTLNPPLSPTKAPIQLRAALAGPFATVTSASAHIGGPKTAEAISPVSYADQLDIDWKEHDESPNHGQTNAYYNVVRAHEFFNRRDADGEYASDILSVPSLDYSMPVSVDDPTCYTQALGCIGQWRGEQGGMCLAGPATLDKDGEECPDVSQNDCTINHEYGHAVVGFIRKDFPMPSSVADPNNELNAMGEAFADHVASMVSNQCKGPEHELKVDRDWVTNDVLDSGAHSNNMIVAGFLWRFRKSISTTMADKLFVQALRCHPSMVSAKSQGPLANFVECLVAEDAALNAPGQSTGPNLEEICDAANAHAITPKVCFGHTEDPIVIVTLPEDYYNPNPVPAAWTQIPGISVWTNPKSWENQLIGHIKVVKCRDGDSLVTAIHYKKTTETEWTPHPQFTNGPGEIDVNFLLLNYETMSNAAYEIRAETACYIGKPIYGDVRTSDGIDLVVRDDQYYEVTVSGDVVLPYDLEITDPDTDGAIHMDPGSSLDCDGNALVGRLGWPSGIAVWGNKADNSVVKNCTVVAFNSGVWFQDSNSVKVSNNNFSFLFSRANPEFGNKPRALQVVRVKRGGAIAVSSNWVGGINAESGDALGIHVLHTKSKNFIADNEFTLLQNTSAIRIQDSAEITIAANTIGDLTDAVAIRARMYNEGQVLYVQDNTVDDLESDGVVVISNEPSSHVLIRGNTLVGEPTTRALRLLNTDSTSTIEDNTISGGKFGISVYRTNAATVKHNIINGAWVGMSVARASDSTIDHNSVVADVHGISIAGGEGLELANNDVAAKVGFYVGVSGLPATEGPNSGSIIRQNDVFESETAILVAEAIGLEISKNTLYGCTAECIFVVDAKQDIDGPSGLNIETNNIEAGSYGIRLDGGSNFRIASNDVNATDHAIVVTDGVGHLFEGNSFTSTGLDAMNVLLDATGFTIIDNTFEGQTGLALHGTAHTVYNNSFDGWSQDVTDGTTDETMWYVEPGTVEGQAITGSPLPIAGNHYMNYNGAPSQAGYLEPVEHSTITGATDKYPLP